MAVAIEDAGFEIRDSLHWIYGSGFPKSLDVSKAIDKMAGVQFEAEPASGVGFMNAKDDGYNTTLNKLTRVEETTEQAKEWQGWGTALKPAHEPIVVARKPLESTVAGNVLQWGTGAINIDGTRVAGEPWKSVAPNAGGRSGGVMGKHTEHPGGEAHVAGRWPANIVFTHNHDCQQIGTRQDTMRAGERTANFGTQETKSGGNGSGDWGGRETTVPIWQCTEGCPVRELDRQSGITKDGVAVRRNVRGQETSGFIGRQPDSNDQTYGGSGGASRFFTVTEWDAPFRYVAKPGKRERTADGTVDGIHPTVKPLALMR
jgi:site-specific DNA-methyltransferase (adenine-specific)